MCETVTNKSGAVNPTPIKIKTFTMVNAHFLKNKPIHRKQHNPSYVRVIYNTIINRVMRAWEHVLFIFWGCAEVAARGRGCMPLACSVVCLGAGHTIKIRAKFLGKKQNSGNSTVNALVLDPDQLNHPQFNDDELERVNKELKYIKRFTKKVIELEKQSITFDYNGQYRGFCVFDLV